MFMLSVHPPETAESDIDPRLGDLVNALLASFRSAARAGVLAARQGHPTPVEDAEALFYRRFQKADRAARTRILERVASVAPAPAPSRVEAPAWLHALLAREATRTTYEEPTASADDGSAAVRLRIRRVTLLDDSPASNKGDLVLGSAVADDLGRVTTAGRIAIGEMSDRAGWVKSHAPPLWFHSFQLAAGVRGSLAASSWPKAYSAIMALSQDEDDEDDAKFLHDLLVAVNEAVARVLTRALGSTPRSVVGSVFDGLIAWFEDDDFPPRIATFAVESHRPANGATQTAPLSLIASSPGGRYRIDYDWLVSWPTTFGNHLDAVVSWENGKIDFFSGARFVRYDVAEDRVDAGHSREIGAGFPGLWRDGVDAGASWGDGDAYFFKGDEYVRFDVAAGRVPAGYPRKIRDDWPGVFTSGIDALMAVATPFASRKGANKAFFFKGDRFVTVDMATRKADGPPASIADAWKGAFARDLDAACYVGELGKAFFFRNAEYVRYDVLHGDRADDGFPARTALMWPGL